MVVRDKGPCKDSSVIRQGNLIMARLPVAPPVFCRMIIAALADQLGPTTVPVSMAFAWPGQYR